MITNNNKKTINSLFIMFLLLIINVSFTNSVFLKNKNNIDNSLITNTNTINNNEQNNLFTSFIQSIEPNQKNSTETYIRRVNEVYTKNFIAKNGQEVTLTTYQMSSKNHNKQFFAHGNCNNNTCASDNGSCDNPNMCKCKQGYAQLGNATHPDPNSYSNNMCTYELKKQLTAFMLETFLIFGIGHFYAGRVFNGLIKLFIFIIIILFDIVFKTCLKSKNWKTQRVYYIVSYALFFGMLFWQTFDVVMFGLNRYKDGNGMDLYVYGDILTTL